MKTNEGANAYRHSLNHHLEFFSKAGSVFMPKNKKRSSYYGNEANPKDLFVNAWAADEKLSMALLFWLRDCRGGSGNRSTSRSIYTWLAKNAPEWLSTNISLLPKIGRWDDLRALFHTPLEQDAGEFWAEAIRSNDVLAAKWADRKDRQIRRWLGLSIADFRRLLARIRSPHIVESKMCTNHWNEIEYKKVPSVAMARYTNAFKKHDEERFNAFIERLKSGTETIHADVLFPHDCVRTALHGQRAVADAQFEALPNFME
jgi:hypothetical protein